MSYLHYPSHWTNQKLKYIASLNSGEGITSEEISEAGEYPVYGGNGVRGYISSYTHDGAFPLIGRQGALCGNIHYASGRFWASEHAVVVNVYDGHAVRWLGEVLRWMNLNQYSQSAAQPGISVEVIENLPIPVPPKEEQRAIASYLDRETARIDSLIAAKEHMLTLLEEKRSTLISRVVTHGLTPNAPCRPSGQEWMVEIPAHWEVKRLKYVVDKIGSGVTPRGGAESYQSEGIPLLRSQNIHFDGLRMDDVVFVDSETHVSMNNSRVQDGDVLLNITGASIGRCFYVEDLNGEANVNQHVCIIRPSSLIQTKFLFFALRSSIGQTQIDRSQTGSGREGLNFELLGNFYLPIPPLDEQLAITKYLENLGQKSHHLTSEVRNSVELLKERRNALITAAVTGQIHFEEMTE
ncbi:MAG: restriction endonuclease subunit S [Pseudohongiella sp.]|nr:restriction endonuclease subunit S [Pseudohongiella sp.]